MREVIKGSLYRHFKGTWYKVLAVAEHTETGERLVIYSRVNASQCFLKVPQISIFQELWN